jgi:hypothetical protein
MTERASPPIKRPSAALLIAATASAFIFLYLRTFLFPATPFATIDDQLLFFVRAVRILHGEVLYRDFFEFVTPGTDLLYAAAFKVFGIHAWVMQAWLVLTGLTIAAVITLIARRLFQGWLMLLPALLFVVFDFNSGLDLTHHWFSSLAALCAVAVLVDEVDTRRLFAASFFCGLAALFTQTEGALAFIALVIYWLWFRWQSAEKSSLLADLAALTLPFVVTVSWVLGYYASKAGGRTLFFDLITFPVRFLSLSKANQPQTYLDQLPSFHHWTDIIRIVPLTFIYFLVPYIYLLGIYRLWRERKKTPAMTQRTMVLLHLFGVALFLAVANGPRYFRLCTVAQPAILICTWWVSGENFYRTAVRRFLCVSALLCAGLFALHRQTQWHGTLNLPIGRTAFSDAPSFRKYQWMAQRTHPSELFYNDAGLGLYLSLTNPTASDFVTYEEFTRPSEVSALVRSLEERPPAYIVLLGKGADYSAARDSTRPFREHVYENYHLVQTFSLGQSSVFEEEIWERKSNLSRAD